jgi:hypothetical protein
MATKKSMFVLFGILSISVWILGSAIQVGAETLNYKNYSYVTKMDSIPVGDVEGHNLYVQIRRAFFLFENGDVATGSAVISGDVIKGSGTTITYTTMTFADGSTIVFRRGVTVGGTAGVSATSASEGEIIKGTGRFEGIKGTITTKAKYLPVEKDEAGSKGIGEGTITYTLPSK